MERIPKGASRAPQTEENVRHLAPTLPLQENDHETESPQQASYALARYLNASKSDDVFVPRHRLPGYDKTKARDARLVQKLEILMTKITNLSILRKSVRFPPTVTLPQTGSLFDPAVLSPEKQRQGRPFRQPEPAEGPSCQSEQQEGSSSQSDSLGSSINHASPSTIPTTNSHDVSATVIGDSTKDDIDKPDVAGQTEDTANTPSHSPRLEGTDSALTTFLGVWEEAVVQHEASPPTLAQSLELSEFHKWLDGSYEQVQAAAQVIAQSDTPVFLPHIGRILMPQFGSYGNNCKALVAAAALTLASFQLKRVTSVRFKPLQLAFRDHPEAVVCLPPIVSKLFGKLVAGDRIQTNWQWFENCTASDNALWQASVDWQKAFYIVKPPGRGSQQSGSGKIPGTGRLARPGKIHKPKRFANGRLIGRGETQPLKVINASSSPESSYSGRVYLKCDIFAANEEEVDDRCIKYHTVSVENLRSSHHRDVHGIGSPLERRYPRCRPGDTEEDKWYATFFTNTNRADGSTWLSRHPGTKIPSPYFDSDEAERRLQLLRSTTSNPPVQDAAPEAGRLSPATEPEDLAVDPRLTEIDGEVDVVDDTIVRTGNRIPQPNSSSSDADDSPSATSQGSPQDSRMLTSTAYQTSVTSLMSTSSSRTIIRLKICTCKDVSFSSYAEICTDCEEICNNATCRGHHYNGPFVQQLVTQAHCEHELGDNTWVYFQICHCPTKGIRGQICKDCKRYPLLHELVLQLKNKHGAEIVSQAG